MQTTANSNYTVLVVDDDIALNHMLREALSGVGFNVLTSSNGLKGLDTMRYGGKVDVVLLDYSMTTLDGSQTLEHLNNQFPNVKAIGITGFDTSELPDTYRNGVEKLLLKPIKIPDLVAAIHSVLGAPVGAETAKRKIDWMRFGLWCTFFVVCYGFLRILYRMASEALFLH
jgi:CheY-like chemotaxis protein